jgi:hypothetical protein
MMNFGLHQEVRSTVEEMSHNGKPQRRRVLRATDVIPPFDKNAQNVEDGGEIPSYDLAENILAEQRRAAGRRRRGPGRVGAGPRACPSEGDHSGSPLHASQDLLELQRVVAEIVARDIERLCRKPDRGRVPTGSVPPVGALPQPHNSAAGGSRSAHIQLS